MLFPGAITQADPTDLQLFVKKLTTNSDIRRLGNTSKTQNAQKVCKTQYINSERINEAKTQATANSVTKTLTKSKPTNVSSCISIAKEVDLQTALKTTLPGTSTVKLEDAVIRTNINLSNRTVKRSLRHVDKTVETLKERATCASPPLKKAKNECQAEVTVSDILPENVIVSSEIVTMDESMELSEEDCSPDQTSDPQTQTTSDEEQEPEPDSKQIIKESKSDKSRSTLCKNVWKKLLYSLQFER